MRNTDDYFIPFIRKKRYENLPPYRFSRIRNEQNNKLPFYNYGDNFLTELKQILLDEYVLENICKKARDCYVCKSLEMQKNRRLEKIAEKTKKVERIIKIRGIERKKRIDKMLAKVHV